MGCVTRQGVAHAHLLGVTCDVPWGKQVNPCTYVTTRTLTLRVFRVFTYLRPGWNFMCHEAPPISQRRNLIPLRARTHLSERMHVAHFPRVAHVLPCVLFFTPNNHTVSVSLQNAWRVPCAADPGGVTSQSGLGSSPNQTNCSSFPETLGRHARCAANVDLVSHRQITALGGSRGLRVRGPSDF